jgi:hypothetical protein
MTAPGTQLALSDELAPVPTDPAANVLGALVAAAQSGGLTAESAAAIKELTGLYEHMQDRNARTAFNGALAAFQAVCPKIPRNRVAKVVSQRKGTSFSYSYASLDDVAATIDPVLTEHGLSYTWDSDVRDGLIHVTSVVRHTAGHEARATFAVPVESDAGSSPAQKYEVALTYGMRRSLILNLGLTWTDPAPEEVETLAPHEVADIELKIREYKLDGGAVFRWLGVTSLYDVPAARYEEVLAALKRKHEQTRAAATP